MEEKMVKTIYLDDEQFVDITNVLTDYMEEIIERDEAVEKVSRIIRQPLGIEPVEFVSTGFYEGYLSKDLNRMWSDMLHEGEGESKRGNPIKYTYRAIWAFALTFVMYLISSYYAIRFGSFVGTVMQKLFFWISFVSIILGFLMYYASGLRLTHFDLDDDIWDQQE